MTFIQIQAAYTDVQHACIVRTVVTSALFSALLLRDNFLCDGPLQRGYDGELLGGTFSRAVFVGNGLIAIVAGLVAHSLVETLGLGPVIPFDTAALVMICGGVIVLFTWTENFGNSSEKRNFLDQLKSGAHAIANGKSSAMTPTAFGLHSVMPTTSMGAAHSTCMQQEAPTPVHVQGEPDVLHSPQICADVSTTAARCHKAGLAGPDMAPSQSRRIRCHAVQTRRLRCWAPCSPCSRGACTPLCSCGRRH